MDETFGWTEIEEISEALLEKYPDRDPLTLRFPELTGMVEGLEHFQPGQGQRVNEQILEAIQAAWYELYQEENS